MKKLTVTGSLLGLIGLVGAGCVMYGATIEKNSFQLRRVFVPILPPGHPPIRILHLSDLHLTPAQTKKISWVRSLARLHPDFIVNTGDNLATPSAMGFLATALRPLAGIPGVFVLGSNDLYAPHPVNPLKYLVRPKASVDHDRLPTQALILMLENLGWDNAEHQRLRYDLCGTTLEVRGCGDAHIGLADYERIGGEPTTADLLIGVTHAPYLAVLDQMTADGTALIFAGHTHGGQVCWPGGRALTTNCDLSPAQAKGLSSHHRGDATSYLHVSAGLGTSPYAPYRFFCPPEASLVTLVPGPPMSEPTSKS